MRRGWGKKNEMLHWNIAGNGITGRTEVRLRAAVRDLEKEERRRGTDSGEMDKPKQEKRGKSEFLFFLFLVSE